LERVRSALASRYAIEREIGRGGMATVYLARDLKHDRPVAIKVFRPDLAASIGAERFLREISIVARLQHPHILPLHDSGTADELIYYVMPFVAGESLADRLNRTGPLPVGEAIHIAREVASALDYAHRQGIIHRDIKPANILLFDGHAVVADFGIARAVSAARESTRITQEGAAVGTPTYMSPEQAAGDSQEVEGPTDIYSLGCVLFEMLTGRPPFEGSDVHAIFAQVVAAKPPAIRTVRSDVPRQVAWTVERALSKKPEERFASGAAFAAALQGESRVWPRIGGRHLALGATATVILGFGAWWLIGSRLDSVVAPDAQVIAVMPFTASGAGIEVLGEGMVDLLSTNLDAVGGIRTVDPRTILRRWRQRARDGGVDLNGALAVGRDVHAGSVLLGSIVEAGAEVRLTAELRAVGGERLAQASADGPADSVLGLVDSLSLRLLREIWRSRRPLPDLRVSAITTGSLDAIRADLLGEQYYRRSHWDSAAAAFGDAIAADPTFALALFRMGQTISWTRGLGSPQAVRLAEAAAQFGDRLPAREHSLINANRLYQAGDLAAIDTLSAFVIRYPDDAEGWYQLGEAQYRARHLLALDDEALLAPYDRVFEIDSTLTPALIHALELSVAAPDSSRFSRYLRALDAGSTTGPAEQFRAARQIIDAGPDSTVPMLARIAGGVGYDPMQLAIDVLGLLAGTGEMERLPLIEAADTLLALLPAGDARRLEVLQLDIRLLISAGRMSAAREAALPIAESDPLTAAGLLLAPAIPGAPGMSGAVADGVRDLDATEPFAPEERQAVRYWRALVALRLGDLAEARQAVSEGNADLAASGPDPYRGLFGAVRGWSSLIRGDTAAGVTAMRRGLRDAGYWPWVSRDAAPLRLVLAQTLVAQPATRAEGLGMLAEGIRFDTPDLVPLALLARARALEASGQLSTAREEWRRLLVLWHDGDDVIRPILTEAERGAAGGGGP